MAKNIKKRNWAFVLYPESAPADWREQLQKTGLQCAISPLHDKDMNPDNTPKKSHYHVILTYSGPTSYNVVKALTDGFNQPIPQALEQVRGYYRYLTHKDNPEKAQYDEREIKTINGFNIADFSELTRSEITQIKKTLQALIRQYDIVEYAQLMDFLQDEEMNVVKQHPLVGAAMTRRFPEGVTTEKLNQYSYEICRYHHERYDGSGHAPRVPKCDQETGEVIEKKES